MKLKIIIATLFATGIGLGFFVFSQNKTTELPPQVEIVEVLYTPPPPSIVDVLLAPPEKESKTPISVTYTPVTASAEPEIEPETPTFVYYDPVPDNCLQLPDNLIYFNAGYAFGKSIYSRAPYGQVELFTLPLGSGNKLYPLLQTDAYILDQGRYAVSVGGGVRYNSTNLCRTFGVNLFVDVMRGFCGTFSQIGPGIESLSNGSGFDFRLNGYIPCGQQGHHCPLQTFLYPGNYVVTAQQSEFIYAGLEGEVGKPIYRTACIDLYTAIGFYSFWNHHTPNVTGVKARACAQLFRYFNVEMRYSNDHFFGSLLQGIVSVTIPFDICKSWCKSSCCSRGCICQPRSIERNDMPLLTQTCCYHTNY